jgi:hypothetical protein
MTAFGDGVGAWTTALLRPSLQKNCKKEIEIRCVIRPKISRYSETHSSKEAKNKTKQNKKDERSSPSPETTFEA